MKQKRNTYFLLWVKSARGVWANPDNNNNGEYQQTEVIRRNSIDEFVKFEPQEGEEKPIVHMILN